MHAPPPFPEPEAADVSADLTSTDMLATVRQMNSRRPALWFTFDFPSGLVVEDSDGSLWRAPEMVPFDGDRSTLEEVRREGPSAFVGELLIDPVGVSEIAHRALVDVSTVHAWRSRHDDFPAPLASLKQGPLWSWSAVERWLRLRPPAGRPVRRVSVDVATATVHVIKPLRADGSTRTFRLRDRFLPGSLRAEIDGKAMAVTEDPDGRRFTLAEAPAAGTVIKLDYRSVLA